MDHRLEQRGTCHVDRFAFDRTAAERTGPESRCDRDHPGIATPIPRPPIRESGISRLLSATTLSLHGENGVLGRLVCASRYTALAEAEGDRSLFLTARAWRVVPLLERREFSAAAVELEAVAELANDLEEPAYLRCAELLSAVEPLFSNHSNREAARSAFLRWAVDALGEAPPVPMRPTALSLLSEIAAALADPSLAEILHTLALHWSGSALDRPWSDAWEVARALGVLAACAGHREDLDRHLAEALRHASDASERALLPLTAHGYAALLRQLAPARSLSLLDEAIRGYARLGMDGERERAEQLATPMRGQAPSALGTTSARRLLREGEYWTFEFDGEVIRLRDSKGLRDLFHLLQHPARPFSALELMDAQDAKPPECRPRHQDTRSLEADGLHAWTPSDAACPDARALREYAERASHLRREIDDARQQSDLGRIDELQAELGILEQELGHYRSLPTRDAASPWERARKAVSKRIRSEIRAIATHHPRLGAHLEDSIQTGSTCSYSPRERTEWSLDAPTPCGLATREVARLLAK